MSFFPSPNTDGRSELACLARHPAVLDQVSFARSEFDQLDKYKLRREACRKQGSLCVYCERKIVEGRPVPRIDRWRLPSLNPGLALRWRNLCLPCPSDETCDSAKGNRPLRRNADDDDMPWPVDFPCEDVVAFTSRGEIRVRSDVAMPEATCRAFERAIEEPADGGQVRPGIVNLNNSMPVKSRAAFVTGERVLMETATANEREECAA